MTPALGRLKRKVREAVAICGGIDGAGATADRSRSVAGDWNNLNHPAFPPLDCVHALDEVAVSQGRVPPIVSGLARELGGVFVPLPDVVADPETLAGMVMQLAARVGDLSRQMAEALADHVVCPGEARALLDLQAEHDAAAARLRLALEALAEREG